MTFLRSSNLLKYIRCIKICGSPFCELYTNGIIQIYFYHKYFFLISFVMILTNILSNSPCL